MNMDHLNVATKRVGAIVFASLMIAVLAACFFRAMMGGGAWIFSDEFNYAAQARDLWHMHASLAQGVGTGNWLYLFINSTCFAFKTDYLSLARAWNVLAIVLAGAVFFVTFRRFAGDITTAVVSAASVALFAAGYARFFMPEAMQFAILVLAICAFHSYGQRSTISRAIFLGGLLGIGGLIKIHVFLLAPCFFVGILVVGYIARHPLRHICVHLLLCVISMLVVAYMSRLAISGRTDFNLLGEFYSGVAKQVGSAWEGIHRYDYVLIRHVETLFLVFPGPAALTILALLGLRRSTDTVNIQRCTMLVLLMCLAGMILVTTIFTVNVAGTGPYESLDRLHGRYYEHILIVLGALSCVHATALVEGVRARARYAVLLGVSICLVASFIGTRGIGWQNPVDFVSVFGLYSVPHAREMALALGLVVLSFLFFRPALSATVCAAVFTLTLGFSAYQHDKIYVGQEVGGVERAAVLLDEVSGSAPVLIVSQSASPDFYRAGFYLLRRNVTTIFALSDGSQGCPHEAIAASWVLVVSPQKLIDCDGLEKFSEFDGAIVYRSRLLTGSQMNADGTTH